MLRKQEILDLVKINTNKIRERMMKEVDLHKEHI